METLLDRNRLDNYISNLNDDTLNGDFDVIFRNAPLPKDSFCGIGPLRGRILQKFANKKSFIFVFGIVGLIFSSSHAYYNGTITTMEKRFKIPSTKMGFIATGNDITGFLLSMFIAYYGGRGHRPRWMAFGILAIVVYCLVNVIPHFLYGAGEDALLLTVEHGAVMDDDKTKAVQESDNNLLICQRNGKNTGSLHDKSNLINLPVTEADAIPCQSDDGNLVAQICLFGAQLIAGVGQTLKHTLGISYLDDNIKKSKTPALLSLSYFIRLLGPAAGYALASLCLKLYIAPELTPVISNTDPRWLGAWYIGWIIIALILLSFTVVMAMFPRELPRAAVRKRIAMEKQKRANASNLEMTPLVEETETSIKDFCVTLKRLMANKVFMLNNFAGIFYVFGFMPFWIFSPKLIETLFKQSSSASSLFTGTFALISSAAGILVAGFVITKFKPSARYLSFWNVVVGFLSVLSVLSFSYMGCEETTQVYTSVEVLPCNAPCNCDFVKYSPVCGADGITYVSPCHAGCSESGLMNKTKTFNECACIDNAVDEYALSQNYSIDHFDARAGPCPVDCQSKLMIFLIVICLMKFIGASGRASNFLVGIRCVEERDKTLAIGLGMTLIRLLAAVPSPILFGYIIDNACIAWGKTCTSRGNCWLYDSDKLRYAFFYTSAGSILIGTIFDALVWKHSKKLNIFDDEDENVEKNVKDAIVNT